MIKIYNQNIVTNKKGIEQKKNEKLSQILTKVVVLNYLE
jgi:hypothetical protein